MVRKCERCGFENQDDYDFCAKCGNGLVEGAKPSQVYVFKSNSLPKLNNKVVILSYIITIFLSWGGVIFSLFSKNTFVAFTFFGFFMPFYLVQSKHPKLRRHGIIQMAISLVGVALSFYVMLH